MSIQIQGNIISWEIILNIKNETANFQKPVDFGFGKNKLIRDEVGFYWAILKNQYNTFKLKQTRIIAGEAGTSETRNDWMLPFFRALGYEPEKAAAEIHNEKSYAISHRCTKRDGFPIHIAGCMESIDRKPATGTLRISPHALVQEYLNATKHLFAIVTNGRVIRLLRDASSLTRLTYLQFDIEKIFEEDLYADFVILFRVLHASRMPVTQDDAENSVIEHYHQETLNTGSRIRDKLSQAVKEVIEDMASALLKHPENTEFIEKIKAKEYSAPQFYHDLLRFIYRFLFITVIEERKLVYKEDKNDKAKRLRDIYYNFYSLKRIRQLAARSFFDNDYQTDLWQSMSVTFQLFEPKNYGKPLDINPLLGDLFGSEVYAFELNTLKICNSDLLKIIRKLTVFQNEQNILSPINYADLNVEEFGSVYEGLLERTGDFDFTNSPPKFSLTGSTARSSSGSHYTPEDLVHPLIKHSLDYLILDKLKEKDPVAALLSLKVCDVACGSGHILLSAARRIAVELACLLETKNSGSKIKVEQASPYFIRQATRMVILNCIYGVDKNPMAVELCKISLWLEAHVPGESLRFLDHRIKCGDSIVGLAHLHELENGISPEAFKYLPGDDKIIAKRLRDANNKEIKNRETGQYNLFAKKIDNKITTLLQNIEEWKKLPEETIEQQDTKKKRFAKDIRDSGTLKLLRQIANLQIAQFFIPKTTENQDKLTTDFAYFQHLKQKEIVEGDNLAISEVTADQRKFFHWFTEFPEVFLLQTNKVKIEPTQTNFFHKATPQTLMDFSKEENTVKIGGFDCILGNPPFLGGQRLSGTYGTDFLEYLKHAYAPAGSCDLVTYFFRRIFNLIKEKGFQSLIATNTIAQGSAREGGLDVIVKQNGSINHAVRSMKWPGLAAVEVALVSIYKGKWTKDFYLKEKKVNTITPYLDDAQTLGNPYQLKQNENKSFQGSIVLGKGFVLEPQQAEALIARNPKNKDVLFPYLNGEDLNSNPDQSPSRWVINFFDFPLRRYTKEEWTALPDTEKERINERLGKESVVEFAPHWYGEKVAGDYPDCLDIVEKLVKPEREKLNRESRKKFWWHFAEKTLLLYKTINRFKFCFVCTRLTKHYNLIKFNDKTIFAELCVVFATDKFKDFCILNSEFHSIYAWKYSSTLGIGTMNYSNSNAFETFPFPQNLPPEMEAKLERIGEAYHEHRRQLMLALQLGLTKLYNQFHNSQLRITNYELIISPNSQLPTRKLDKETVNLLKHFEKTKPAISLQNAIAGIEKLRTLHVEMDEAVLEAYSITNYELRITNGVPAVNAPSPFSKLQLNHNFYEVDYLPEGDNVRFTISPEARKEILKFLLELNYKVWEEEVKAEEQKRSITKKQ